MTLKSPQIHTLLFFFSTDTMGVAQRDVLTFSNTPSFTSASNSCSTNGNNLNGTVRAFRKTGFVFSFVVKLVVGHESS